MTDADDIVDAVADLQAKINVCTKQQKETVEKLTVLTKQVGMCFESIGSLIGQLGELGEHHSDLRKSVVKYLKAPRRIVRDKKGKISHAEVVDG